MNAALGFDSFVVMRHGVKSSFSDEAVASASAGDAGAGAMAGACAGAFTKVIPGNQLGCYFCNDVVGPGGKKFPFLRNLMQNYFNIIVKYCVIKTQERG